MELQHDVDIIFHHLLAVILEFLSIQEMSCCASINTLWDKECGRIENLAVARLRACWPAEFFQSGKDIIATAPDVFAVAKSFKHIPPPHTLPERNTTDDLLSMSRVALYGAFLLSSGRCR
jgi:hypothetical protein